MDFSVGGVSLGAAFLAGMLSFLSPCVLPLVPPYLIYLTGVSAEAMRHDAASHARWRAVRAASAFVLGFSTVFVALGAAASVLGQLLRAHLASLRFVAGVLIVLMGLHFLRVLHLPFLMREVRWHGPRRDGPLAGYVMGLAFAFGWTPCIGPVLAAVLALAGSEDDVGKGVVLLGTYAAGLGLPFLLAAFLLPRFMAHMPRLRSLLLRVEQAMGALLVLVGVAFLTGGMTWLSLWLLETFPALQRFG
jgi:cytochrome c-type biogenesis protein